MAFRRAPAVVTGIPVVEFSFFFSTARSALVKYLSQPLWMGPVVWLGRSRSSRDMEKCGSIPHCEALRQQ